MRNLRAIVLFCILALVWGQAAVDLSLGDQLKNPEFVKVLNNYFGCKTWDNGVCVQCSDHYYFNAHGVCCEVKPQCRNFNRQVGICEACYEGYGIVNGECVRIDLINSAGAGCKTWIDGKCAECSNRWYFDANGNCQQISDLCRTWTFTGLCETCYPGFVLQTNGQCIADPSPFRPAKDDLCAVWSERVCIKCAERAFFDSNGVCREVSTNCASWDLFDGLCLSCYNGYDLIKGQCSLSPIAQPKDLGCKIWDWNKQVCLTCSDRWTFNTKGVCVPVSDNCNSWDASGACVSCYKGYEVVKGQCVLSAPVQAKDLGCKTWDWDRQVCLACSDRWTFNSKGVCVPVSDNCNQFDASGACVSCYKGYEVVKGQCVESAIVYPKDLGCKTWDWDRQVCLACSDRWAANSKGVCVPVSDLCKQYAASGACESCYKGYELAKGQCVLSPDARPSDLGCKTWDWDKQVCLACSDRWTFNSKGVCVPVSDNCNTWEASGACSSCYKGYELNKGQCVLSALVQPKDLGCKTWDWDRQVCLACSDRWTFNSKGACVPVSDNCNQFDASGACVSCFKGYEVVKGECVLSAPVQPKDLGCKTWDWDRQVCLACSDRWTFNSKGVCVPVSDNCNQFDASGACVSCFKGYEVVKGQCVLSAIAQPKDLGCKTWDWDRQVCLACSDRWTFNSKGVCVPVSDNCNQFDASGACVSCFKGYEVVKGECVLSAPVQPKDLGCKTWDWDRQVCLACSDRWTFNSKGVCVPVSDNCNQFDASGACVSCFKGYEVVKGECVLSAIAQPKDLGCKTWDWDRQVCLACSDRWTFNSKGVCVPVSDNCNQFDASGACVSCFKGYEVVKGECVLSAIAQPKDLGCKTWDWDRQVCLACSDRWTFNSKGVCVPVSDNCNQFDASGACVSCFKGYEVVKGECVLSAPVQPKDLGCKTWDWDRQVCLACSDRWTFNSKGVCVPVSDNCNSWDASGACVSCYKGYELNNGQCVLSAIAQPKDLGCKTWDWDRQVCLACSDRWTFNSKGVCVPVSDNCNQFDASGACVSCFKGYEVVKGECVLSAPVQPKDLGCKTWDWDRQVCLECSARWTFNSKGVCVPVSDNCNQFDASGACVSCFKGYEVVKGQCVLSAIAQPKDLGCKTWDWDRQVCLECSTRWTFNSKGVCVPVSDNCNQFDASGACVSCYKGYEVVKGQCVLSAPVQPKDLGCKTWDWDRQVCLACSDRWTFNSKGVCVPVSDNCNSWDASGACVSCYKGYELNNGQCVLSAIAQPKDLGCKTWDWDRQVCLACSDRWTFNSKGVCVPVSDNCNSWDASGACVSCYKGYEVVKGQCVLSAPVQPKDLGCKTWDWDRQVCLACSERWTFNSKGVCVPVSDNCNQFDASGACTSCYNGYQLVQGQCQLLNTLCKTSNNNGGCASCYTGYVLYKNSCTPLSKLADLVLYYTECCPEKLQQLKAEGRL